MFFAHRATGEVYHATIINNITDNEIKYEAHTSERDCETYNKGEHIYGSSNVYAKWYIEKKNGNWEVVKVKEKP